MSNMQIMHTLCLYLCHPLAAYLSSLLLDTQWWRKETGTGPRNIVQLRRRRRAPAASHTGTVFEPPDCMYYWHGYDPEEEEECDSDGDRYYLQAMRPSRLVRG